VKTLTNCVGGLLLLIFAAQLSAQLQIGDNTHLGGGGTVSVGYSGDYGNLIQSSHNLDFGANAGINGYYYNPNFLNFTISPYYNQSRADSNYQSLTDASGVSADANFFTGSHFPGSVSYRYDYNSTGTFGLAGAPNFTTQGTGQGFGINWSAIFPDWPTLSVGYQHGSGNGTIYGTNQETSSHNSTFNLRSNYRIAGFGLGAYYDHTSVHGFFPEVLTGSSSMNDSTGYSAGISASRGIPLWKGSFWANYSHNSYNSDYVLTSAQTSTNSGYNADIQSAGATFRPTQKLGLYLNEGFTNNLSSYFLKDLTGNSLPLPGFIPSLGTNSYSLTMGGGLNYLISQHLNANANITHYSQSYLGNTYDGTFLSGNLNYNRKILDTFTVSAGIVDSTSNFGNNNFGFVGNVNGFHAFGAWQVAGNFNYAQNVQSELITYTTSYYNYSTNLHRRFSNRVQWTLAFNGSHSGLSQEGNSSNASATFSTSLSLRQIAFSANYGTASGNSILTTTGPAPAPPPPNILPGNLIDFRAENYGGAVNWTPIARMSLSATYTRSFSRTLSNSIFSRNDTDVFYSQLQYQVRRIGLMAGYTYFSQGISATGIKPGVVNSYYAGISRWFNIF